MNSPWTFSEIWNKSLDQPDERKVAPRNRIWASELGKADVDIYLKLIGEKPSNLFDARSRRKFEAGNLFEWIVKLVLVRCGIYKESQKWIGHQVDSTCLEVSGKLDHLAGGMPRYEEAKREIHSLGLPEIFNRATDNILAYFQQKFPEGLPDKGIEVKSVSSYGIEKVYFTNKALQGHDLQAFHYAYNTGIPFTLLYICRDDLRMAELPIMPNDEKLLARYQEKVRRMSDFYNKKIEPPKEAPIVFAEETQRFSKNFNVEYSSYLTRNYAIETPALFDEQFSPTVESWNRVITRIKDGKTLTDNNRAKIAEMAEWGLDIMKLLDKR